MKQVAKAKADKVPKEKEPTREKPYKMTYSETYVEPVGMGPVKEK
ncbi:hypothetical protein [Phosphitispora fastidiosa]|nr:hypothetical protein [Phosphitispora fastidiosa]MBU7008104.1 hypothetical protein [Phosphitispora fastidiosa]